MESVMACPGSFSFTCIASRVPALPRCVRPVPDTKQCAGSGCDRRQQGPLIDRLLIRNLLGRFQRIDDVAKGSFFFDRPFAQGITATLDRKYLKRLRVLYQSDTQPAILVKLNEPNFRRLT